MNTATPISTETTVDFILDEPVTITRDHDGAQITGTKVRWTAYFCGPGHPQAGLYVNDATLFTDDHDNARIVDISHAERRGHALSRDDFPDWLPLPPAGWADHVHAYRATHPVE